MLTSERAQELCSGNCGQCHLNVLEECICLECDYANYPSLGMCPGCVKGSKFTEVKED